MPISCACKMKICVNQSGGSAVCSSYIQRNHALTCSVCLWPCTPSLQPRNTDVRLSHACHSDQSLVISWQKGKLQPQIKRIFETSERSSAGLLLPVVFRRPSNMLVYLRNLLRRFYVLPPAQYIDTGPTSPSSDP